MRLIIKRGYVEGKKSFMGGTAPYFTLYCKADFTKEQKALIEKYDIFNMNLTNEKIPGKDNYAFLTSTITSGIELNFNNIGDCIVAERIVKGACVQLHGILAALSLVGTESIIDYEVAGREKDDTP